nr:RagB/SusD family nutrient uptake outer membrane protein [Ferruginibacter sp.]
NALNMVRRRGYGKPMTTPDAAVDIPSGLSKTDFFKALVRERALELGGEGIRKYDLIRWNLLATALAETKANLLKMSTNTVMTNPTYMAGYPPYCLSTTLPTFMYYINNTTSDNNNMGGLWFNSLYKTAPGTTPAGTTRVNWVRAEINTVALARYATGYTVGKSELLPFPNAALGANTNLKQNPNY